MNLAGARDAITSENPLCGKVGRVKSKEGLGIYGLPSFARSAPDTSRSAPDTTDKHATQLKFPSPLSFCLEFSKISVSVLDF